MSYFTLYVITVMSSSLLFLRVGRFTHFNNCSYDAFQSQEMALKAHSWMCSSLWVSVHLQKCQTVLQYVMWGRIAALYSANLAFVGISFGSLLKTLTCWLVFLHILLMWLLNDRLRSIFIPSNFISWKGVTAVPLMFISILVSSLPFPISIPPNLEKFPRRKFTSY